MRWQSKNSKAGGKIKMAGEEEEEEE